MNGDRNRLRNQIINNRVSSNPFEWDKFANAPLPGQDRINNAFNREVENQKKLRDLAARTSNDLRNPDFFRDSIFNGINKYNPHSGPVYGNDQALRQSGYEGGGASPMYAGPAPQQQHPMMAQHQQQINQPRQSYEGGAAPSMYAAPQHQQAPLPHHHSQHAVNPNAMPIPLSHQSRNNPNNY